RSRHTRCLSDWSSDVCSSDLTPLIEFLSKGAHFANLTGEKLSEYHVTQAMQEAQRELNVALTAYSLAPCWPAEDTDDFTPCYGQIGRASCRERAQSTERA